MKNYNSLNNKPSSKPEKNGWDKVSELASKKQAEKTPQHQGPNGFSKKTEELSALRENASKLAKKSGAYKLETRLNERTIPYREKTYREKDYRDKEKEYKEAISYGAIRSPESTVKEPIKDEVLQIGMLIKKREKLLSEEGGLSKQHNKELKAITSELTRHGFKEYGTNSPIFDWLKGASQSYVYTGTSLAQLGRARIENYSMLKWYANQGGAKWKEKRAVKRALKEAGFKKIPEKWNDKNFTTYEVQRMCEVAKFARDKAEAKK